MARKLTFSALFTLLLCTLCSATVISYDGEAVTVNGERKLLISGSIHYPRSTPEMWPSLIQKAKEGGLNTIETYVFWNAHEPLPRQYDFTGNLDIVKFINTVQDAGLYAILRIGPYVCAEWNYGGLPVWLHNMGPDVTLRTTNPIYMDEMKIFVTKIVNIMKEEKLFASDGGPILLAQIENEFGNVQDDFFRGGADIFGYIDQNVDFAESLNIGIPWIMCQQSGVKNPMINTGNGFYGDQFYPRSNTTYFYPKFWTENWTGWYQQWGESQPHRPAEDIAFAVARFFQRKGTMQNYYMYHGGTNFGRVSGGPYIITSYDYDAPLNEYGLVNQPKWGHLKQLHQVILSIDQLLLYGSYNETKYYNSEVYATVYSHNGSRVCFFSNSLNNEMSINFEGNWIKIPPWAVRIFKDCQTEVYNTAQVNVQTNVYDKVKQGTLEWTWRAEKVEHIKDHKVKHPPTFSPQLLEQKAATSDTSDYLWYMTSVVLDKNNPLWGRELTVQAQTAGNVLHIFFNGKHIGKHEAQGGNFQVEGIGGVKHGLNSISLLSATVGLPNYGAFYDKIKQGVIGPVKLIASNGDEVDLTNGTWGYKVGINGIDEKKLYSEKERRNWKSNIQVNRPFVWYKTTFDTPPGDDPVVVDLEEMGKGTAWVNGNNIGRYWPSYLGNRIPCLPCTYIGQYNDTHCRTNCGEPSQKWYHVPRSFLNEDGKNDIVLFEEYGGNPTKVAVHTVTLPMVCAHAHEGSTLNLTCEKGTMSEIKFASFGEPTGTCGAFVKGKCDASSDYVMSVVRNQCVGKKSCEIDVSENTFGPTSGCLAPTRRRHAVQVMCS